MTLKQTADDEMKYLVKEFLLTNILYNKTIAMKKMCIPEMTTYEAIQ